MRVLLWMIAGGNRIPGGHITQIEQTCRHLNDLGIDAEISYQERQNLANYDLVHGFGTGSQELRRCREAGAKIALSTIYCNKKYIMGQHISNAQSAVWKGRLRIGMVLLRSALQGNHVEKCEALIARLQQMRVCYEIADILLPNSKLEAKTIQSELGVSTPFHVVPNAVDHTRFHLEEREQPYEKKGVLYVGRFEPHKNQLGLIRAMQNTKINVNLVGPPHPDHAAYYSQCRRRATGNISISPGIPHEALASLYSKAKVHILPSWFETTGLVSLEAALCGCNIVTTDRGYAREYFQDMAWYCDPADPQSIRDAVEAAYQAPYRTELRDRILNNYTWEHTARATAEAYTLALKQPRHILA